VLGGRIVNPGDPLWSQDDTDLAVALTEIDGERHTCGHPRSESMDPAHEFDWEAEAVRCHACAARDRAARAVGEGWDDAGINWITTRRGGG
jgi:hypothetical protein